MDRHQAALDYALSILIDNEYSEYILSVYLFGSFARKEAKYHSDVDLLVKIQEDTPAKVMTKLRGMVIPDDYTLPEVELKFSKGDNFSSSRQFNENLEKEAILLWERT